MIQADESPGNPLASASGVESPLHSTVSTEFGSLRLLSMSAQPSNEPFTVAEKIELLVNILQQLLPDLPSYLLQVILVDLQMQPQWSDIALPRGRTLHACQIAFEDMRRQQPRQPGPIRPYTFTTYPPIAPAPATMATGRSFSEHDPNLARRPIQPRLTMRSTESPPVTNGESPSILRTAHPEPAAPETSRKRGRPSKAEVEERDRKFAAEGKVYVPKKRPAKRPRPSLPPDAPEFKDEESTTPLLQTPSARTIEPAQESSSGKRRRRLTRDESPLAAAGNTMPESLQQEGEKEAESNIAESPSDRLLLSHRDRGSVGSSLSRPTHQESEPVESGQGEPEYIT